MNCTRLNEHESRRKAMTIFAAATAEELERAIGSLADLAAVADLKSPEMGLVMLRGRIGGDGAPFNIGEATVTRAVVRLVTGEIGYGVRLGRDATAARSAAILDALWQAPRTRRHIEAAVLQPITERLQTDQEEKSRQAAATRVEFFTLAREAT
jgi:alpha-D-ribose 1-methylphosphonate 5-triphosphate synthase subunit PhnG